MPWLPVTWKRETKNESVTHTGETFTASDHKGTGHTADMGSANYYSA